MISDYLGKDVRICDYCGLRLLLDDRSYVDKAMLRDGYWEKAEIDYFSVLWQHGCGKKKFFFDIGSYFGLYSLHAWMSKQFDEIHAFEADAYNYSQLRAQMFLNEAMGIKAHNLAVSDYCGMSRITSSLDNRDNRGVTFLSDEGREEVECTALDVMFPNLAGAAVFVKIDVEGHELRVLKGMRDIIMNNQAVLQIEIYREENKYDFLDEYGLRVINEVFPDVFVTNMADIAPAL
jgi:FkbM family methyltransferase